MYIARIITLIGALLALVTSAFAQGQSIPVFASPFDGQFPLGNWHDHNVPREFIDTNGVIVNSEGRTTDIYIDGHEGYDWLMDEGTPIKAVADGTVRFAGIEDPFYCPILEQTTSGNLIILDLTVQGETFSVIYAHSSQLLVSSGQAVRKGDVIALSGNTGCSTTPHLHFAVFRATSFGSSIIDPYGWNGSGSDPWESDPSGAPSLNLWEDGIGPDRFLESFAGPNDCEGCSAPIAVTRVRFMGPDDTLNPNNEYVELTLDRRFARSPISLKGYKLRNNNGKSYKFKKSAKIKAGRPIRIFTGKGRDTAKTYYWGQKTPQWEDHGDCVHLFDGRGRLAYYFFIGEFLCRYVNQASAVAGPQPPIELESDLSAILSHQSTPQDS